MSYSFLDLALEVLKSEKEPLSVNEIWKKGEEKGLTSLLNSQGKTPENTLGARIYVDIKKNKNSSFIQTNQRPAKFFLIDKVKDLNNNESTDDNESDLSKRPYHERDLHKLLATFVFSNPHFNCYTKTIYHEVSKKTKKRGHNEWLHPDMVGIYFPFDEFKNNTLKLLEALKENPYKLFAFELKTHLDFSNLRKSYFQAVSNASWANEGYLVALDFYDGSELIDELRRLNSAFGIGVIKLDPKNIEQSEIIFSAKFKENLDWNTIDRLTNENSDFENFINDLMEDIKIGKAKSKYDAIFNDDEEVSSYLFDKKILLKS